MVTSFYERKRRLAYVFAILSLVLLIGNFYVGFLNEIYKNPRIARGPEGFFVLHSSTVPGEDLGARILILDHDLKERADAYRLMGDARSLINDAEGLTTFFPDRYSVLRGGDTLRSVDLGQKWELLDSARGRGGEQAWIFGWHEGNVVGRRRTLGKFSTEIVVAPSGDLNWLSASMEGDRGPLVAWREEGSSEVRTAFHDGTMFVEGDTVNIDAAPHWDAVRFGGRTVVLSYQRDDRTFTTVALRVHCCGSCGKEPLPDRIVFDDPVFLLGKVVTGVAAAADGDRLAVAVTRQTTLQAGLVRLEAGGPDPLAATLVPLGAEPLWRRIAAALTPLMMLFFSFSLVFLGFTLLRERGQFVLEMVNKPVEEGPRPAELLQRAMAYILDLIVVFPVYYVAVVMLNVSPETSRIDVWDPKFQAMMGVWYALRFLYYFVGDVAAGCSIGKKIIGIRVVELDGSKLTLRGALVRNLLRPLDAELILTFLGASVMMTSKLRQRPGDMLARTRVIQEGEEEKDESRVAPPPRR